MEVKHQIVHHKHHYLCDKCEKAYVKFSTYTQGKYLYECPKCEEKVLIDRYYPFTTYEVLSLENYED